MKIRQGFVSNSSSSSFILKKNDITEVQLYMIQNHIEVGRMFNKVMQDVLVTDYYDTDGIKDEYLSEIEKDKDEHLDCMEFYTKEEWVSPEWNIKEDDDTISGSTSMDNFEMIRFLNYIGISDDKIQRGDW